MPPVEFDTIPRIPTHSVDNVKESVASCDDVLELGSFEPIITRSSGIIPEDSGAIEDVKIPEFSTVVIKDVPVVNAADNSFGNNVTDKLASYSLVRTGLKTLDFGLDLSEKILLTVSAPSTKHVQSMRRHLRAIRHAGRRHARRGIESSSSRKKSLRQLPSRKSHEMRESSLFGYVIELFQVNWFLSFFGITLAFVLDSLVKSERKNDLDDQDCSDEETTVYKLMKGYESQDDIDYLPSDSSVDSMEFHSDLSEDETTVDKLMKDYSDIEDCEYVPSDASEDSIEYNSDAEVSEESDYEGSDSEELSEEETTVGMIMKDYSEESAEDTDYIPCEEAEGDLEYDSNAEYDYNASSSEDTESSETSGEDAEEESQEDVVCETPACKKTEHEIVEELSQEAGDS